MDLEKKLLFFQLKGYELIKAHDKKFKITYWFIKNNLNPEHHPELYFATFSHDLESTISKLEQYLEIQRY